METIRSNPRRSVPTGLIAATIALALLAACTGGGSSPSGSPATSSVAVAVADRFPHCDFQPPPKGWRCGLVAVPLDRADPAAGTIPLNVNVLPHSDTSTPAGEPVFMISGGPGDSGYTFGTWSVAPILHAHHDVVWLDPRGTGNSDAIDCEPLQQGWTSPARMHAAFTACATQLGGTSDRYGSGDVALDLDEVRAFLGYERIDLLPQSYGAVVAQAYAARFPDHVHAIVFDAGFPADDPDASYWWSQDYPKAYIRVDQLICDRQPGCDVHVAADIAYLARTLRASPVAGLGRPQHGRPRHVVVDEAAFVTLMMAGKDLGPLPPEPIGEIATALRAGDHQPLLDAAATLPPGMPSYGDPAQESAGASAAAWCTDWAGTGWDPSGSLAERRQQFARTVAAFPATTFAPFSRDGWVGSIWGWYGACLTWPAPDRLDPPIPAGSVTPQVPTLLLVGDEDLNTPIEMVRRLLAVYPQARIVTVAGAGHPVMDPAWAGCAPKITERFFDTLDAGDTACASHLR